jgi:muramoyltetrapeptide carboxypeptidase
MSQKIIIPKKLNKGANVRVVALSRSMLLLSKEVQEIATQKLVDFGVNLSFGKHIYEKDEFMSSSIQSRVEDLHSAFVDTSVDGILTVIGGYNSNQLLSYLDYDLIKNNPKILCGFSDITAVSNAITAMTGMVTYTGPHYSSWAMIKGFDYSAKMFEMCCMQKDSYYLRASKNWSDDLWFLDQENRKFNENEGYWVINQGYGLGKTVGGHLRCLNALQGTKFMPSLQDAIVLMEEDEEINPQLFDRQLQSLIHQKDFSGVKGILIGRFQNNSKMTRDLLNKIVSEKLELKNIPIIANIDFGHTTPASTLPIGGVIEVIAENSKPTIKIIEH